MQARLRPWARLVRAAAAVSPPLLVILSPLTQLSYIPISVGIGHDLDMSEAQMGLAIGAHAAATAVAGLAFGPMLDAQPVRRLLLPSVIVTAVASAVMGLSPSVGSLVVGRVVVGLSSGVASLCGFVLMTDMAHGDDTRRDRGFSLLQTFMAIGAGSALGLGAFSASTHRPMLVFGVLTLVSVALLGIVLMTPIPPHPMPAGSARERRREILRGVWAMVGQRRMQWLLVASLVLGLVIQGTHYGVSVLLDAEADDITTWQRILLSVLVPCGVFTGSSINRRVLRTVARQRLYSAMYAVLPFAMGLYALTTAIGASRALVALSLLLAGTCLGAMMPLSTAIAVGWYQGLRGSATAAENLARSIGQTAGPVLVGAVVAASSVSWALWSVAAVAVLGWIALRGLTIADRASSAPAGAQEVEVQYE